MSDLFLSEVVGNGTRLQSGIPKGITDGISNPNGLLLRGVVMATYVLDDPDHPYIKNPKNTPVAVYCDVVVYPSIARQRWFFLKKVLVSQDQGGLHDDRIWKPKATKINIKQKLDRTVGSNIFDFDGDCVLIGFLNNTFDQPIILKGLPHPNRDIGNELFECGKRTRLKVVDGDPDFHKHHGSFYGVDDSGNFVIDTTYANDGTTDATGMEPLPDITGDKGNQTRKLPLNSKYKIVLYDMTIPVSPREITSLTLQKDNLVIKINEGDGITIENKDGEAKIVLGDGAVKAAIADHLEDFYTNNVKVQFETHKHPTGTGPSGTPDIPFPTWDGTINSSKLTFPDG